MPGIGPEKDVDVSVANGELHIRAQREEQSEEKSKDGFRSEFRYGSFTRDIPLPEGIKDDDITASDHDGVLEVRAPGRPQAQTQAQKVQMTRA